MEQYKTCTKCGQIKNLDEFHNSKSHKSGKKSACKLCNTAAAVAYQKATKDTTYPRITAWRKNNPEKTKEYSRLARIKRADADREYRKTYYLNNVEAKRQYSRQYAISNPEKLYEKGRRWREANPEKLRRYSIERRSRKKLASVFLIRDKDITRILAQPCLYCGKEGGTLDHVIPLVRGGLHGIGNLVSACERCNKSKSDKFITEWKKVRGW